MPTKEAEHYLADAANVKNVGDDYGGLSKKATRYLRYNERQRRQDEARRLKEMLTPTNIMAAKMGEQSVAEARKHLSILQRDLTENSPPSDLSGETRDALYKELKREEEIYRQGFLSHEEMRRNPVGAVGRNIRHERANKDRALKIKNLRVLLNPDSDDPDVANLEDLRPSIFRPDGTSTFMGDAQIPGVFGMTPQAKENWPENMPEYGTVNSPLKQAEERESREAELMARIEQLEAELQAKKEEKRKRRVDKQLRQAEARFRMKEYWRKKKEAQAAQVEPQGE